MKKILAVKSATRSESFSPADMAGLEAHLNIISQTESTTQLNHLEKFFLDRETEVISEINDRIIKIEANRYLIKEELSDEANYNNNKKKSLEEACDECEAAIEHEKARKNSLYMSIYLVRLLKKMLNDALLRDSEVMTTLLSRFDKTVNSINDGNILVINQWEEVWEILDAIPPGSSFFDSSCIEDILKLFIGGSCTHKERDNLIHIYNIFILLSQELPQNSQQITKHIIAIAEHFVNPDDPNLSTEVSDQMRSGAKGALLTLYEKAPEGASVFETFHYLTHLNKLSPTGCIGKFLLLAAKKSTSVMPFYSNPLESLTLVHREATRPDCLRKTLLRIVEVLFLLGENITTANEQAYTEPRIYTLLAEIKDAVRPPLPVPPAKRQKT